MKNDFEIRGDTTAIFLRRRNGTVLETLIDTADLEYIASYECRWCATSTSFRSNVPRSPYAKSNLHNGKTQRYTLLHHILCPIKPGLVVDHINHNTLDNRRSNLRLVSVGFNSFNRSSAQANSNSQVRGVYWNKERQLWDASVRLHGRRLFFKRFQNFEDARIAVETTRAEIMAELLKDERHAA